MARRLVAFGLGEDSEGKCYLLISCAIVLLVLLRCPQIQLQVLLVDQHQKDTLNSQAARVGSEKYYQCAEMIV